ncbi:MAG TPA: beta-N-acetylhexosaminidase [Candidatus Ozemobacteraceae bacterium]|nr:beta-N-acetylhexosaminidase [Candidatus Ozemobacteraceae bacterium]
MDNQLRRRIGNLFVIGYQGLEPSPEVLAFVEEWGIGGVIVFARNLADPSALPGVLGRFESAAGRRLFTSIDQEGGLVMRILSQGSLFPGAMALSASGDPDLARRIGAAVGAEMRALGLNWNLAPVLDINHAGNPGIGARSFGDTPETVIKYSKPYISGLREGGVLACAKHFPGKGHAKVDSHLTLPVIPYDRERLLSFELAPFKAAIEAGIDAVMTAHVFFPAFEPAPNLPATLSEAVLTGLLRRELGFKGLLITDDLEMGAITEAFGVPDAARRAFLAGADQLLICHDLGRQREAAEAILREASTSAAAMRRLEESLARIETARDRLAASAPPAPLDRLAASHAALVSEAHDRAVLVDTTAAGDLPLAPATPLVVACPHIASLVQVEEEHRDAGPSAQFLEAFPHARCVVYEPKAGRDEILPRLRETLAQAGPDARVVLLSYNAHIFPGQEQAFRAIAAERPGTILAALRNPYDLAGIPEATTRIATFGFRSPDIRSLLGLLLGRLPARCDGWPVRLR